LWNDLSPPPNPREFNGIVLYILVLNQQQSCQSVDSREAIFAKIYSILISYSVLPYWQCHLDDNLNTIDKRKSTKRQTMIYKPLHRKVKNAPKVEGDLRCSGRVNSIWTNLLFWYSVKRAIIRIFISRTQTNLRLVRE
jgi:hypothetical protein